MPELEINFQFVASAQTLLSKPNEIKGVTDGFARMIVDDVALGSTATTYKNARRALVGNVRKVIREEVYRMGRSIARFFVAPESATGPVGAMSIRGRMSATAKVLNFRQTFTRESTGIKWKKRTSRYLNRKRRDYGHTRWWERKGNLQDDFEAMDGDEYETVFGPVRVLFRPAPVIRDAKGRFQRPPAKKMGGAVDPQSGGAMQTALGGTNVTRSGLQGRYTAEYEVGRLEVSLFNKITPQMLPSLADPTWQPSKARPTSGEGLAGLFPKENPKAPAGIRRKLVGRQAVRRYALEPFVAFYMNRAIPNAVWRRTEQLMGNNY